ncbi:hypothetical protein COU58_01055 [Candidatus Pacearchaeota archaeon CG10_big_fil_rev_8_21_14_0_10_32_42]|nr:MAG: hypothetical protein COU58_01055 [Candidatus Pacearchaeota archaeon CG10_big_fil_rev_8_21_14_0_10_32_42]
MRLEEKLNKFWGTSKSYIRRGALPLLASAFILGSSSSCGGGKKPTTPITNQNPTVEIKSGA